MNKTYTGIAFLVMAFLAFALMVAGSHGHIMFRPHMGEDWLLWGTLIFFSIIGLLFLVRRGKK